LNTENFAFYLKKNKLPSAYGTAATWLGISSLAFLRMAFKAGTALLKDSGDDLQQGNGIVMGVVPTPCPSSLRRYRP
jgi:hypothetical protein